LHPVRPAARGVSLLSRAPQTPPNHGIIEGPGEGGDRPAAIVDNIVAWSGGAFGGGGIGRRRRGRRRRDLVDVVDVVVVVETDTQEQQGLSPPRGGPSRYLLFHVRSICILYACTPTPFSFSPFFLAMASTATSTLPPPRTTTAFYFRATVLAHPIEFSTSFRLPRPTAPTRTETKIQTGADLLRRAHIRGYRHGTPIADHASRSRR
jgi:hypothetical protein